MNKLAQFIGMTQTKFVNPHGLERRGAVGTSTAADMARLGLVTMRRNAINFIVRQKDRKISVTGPLGTRGYTVRNSNELLGKGGILGTKPGHTDAAGPCLATCMDKQPLARAKPDGTMGATPRRLIVVFAPGLLAMAGSRGLATSQASEASAPATPARTTDGCQPTASTYSPIPPSVASSRTTRGSRNSQPSPKIPIARKATFCPETASR